MSPKRIARRPRAIRDIEDATAYYLKEAGRDTALGYIDAMERAFDHIARHPAAGSPRFAHELGLSGLRSWPVTRFPYLILYVEGDDDIEIWRVLHAGRDIPAHMREG